MGAGDWVQKGRSFLGTRNRCFVGNWLVRWGDRRISVGCKLGFITIWRTLSWFYVWRVRCVLVLTRSEREAVQPFVPISVVNNAWNLGHIGTVIVRLLGRDSSVGIETRYGLGGPGIESWWGEIFRNRPDRPWGPPSLLFNGYRVSFPGVKRPGRGFDRSPHLAPRLKKE
jgi:hypothetical protein